MGREIESDGAIDGSALRCAGDFDRSVFRRIEVAGPETQMSPSPAFSGSPAGGWRGPVGDWNETVGVYGL